MKSWKSVLALAFAGVLVSTFAFAQATTPTGDQKAPDASEKPKSDTGTSASPSTSDTTKSGAADMDKADKSGAMKSGKSDTMKSDMMKSGKSARGGNHEQVRAAQQALKDKGHDPGTVDGVMGPKTQAALKDFQKSQGIQETGRLDAETMSKLGVEGRSSAADQSTPSASPSTTGSSAPGAKSSDSSAKPADSGAKSSDSGTKK